MLAELRTEPRVSLNKLAEYLVASPRRRRRLILDQIESVVFKAGRYGSARAVLRRFICDPTRKLEWLKAAAARLRDRASEPDVEVFDAKCLRGSARAIEAFLPIAEDFRYEDAIAVPGARRDSSITVSGVRVSVAPEISIIAPGTERRIGGVKLHFGVTYPLNQEARRYAAAILFSFIEATGGTPLTGLCDAVDVFTASYESAPRAIKRRLEDVEAACEEIAERWPRLLETLERARQQSP